MLGRFPKTSREEPFGIAETGFCRLDAWAAPLILRWGTKQDWRAERANQKFCTPTFPNVGYKQTNISRGLLNILKFAACLSH